MRLQRLLSQHFPDLVRAVRLLHPGDGGKWHIGKHQCGEFSLVTKYFLEGCGYAPQVWQNQQGSGDYATDHTFLMLGDFYIDLTYRQILESDCSQSDDCPYRKHLLFGLPEYFLGTQQQLDHMCDTLDRIHQTYYGNVIDTEFKMDWARKRWSRQTPGDPKRFDMEQVVLVEPACLDVRDEIDKCLQGIKR